MTLSAWWLFDPAWFFNHDGHVLPRIVHLLFQVLAVGK